MKAAWAILLCALLGLIPGTGWLSAASAEDGATQEICCCGNGRACCGAKAPTDSPSAPAVPACSSAATQLQLAPPSGCSVFSLDDFAAARLSFPVPSVFTVGVVPLYRRNCAYLL